MKGLFFLTNEQLLSMFHGHCGLCGTPMDVSNVRFKKLSKENDRGKGDIISCCSACWKESEDMSIDEYRSYLLNLYNQTLESNPLVRMGLIEMKPFSHKFFFEKWNSLSPKE